MWLLGSSEKLKYLLKNPHLRRMVTYLDSSAKPWDDVEKAMHEPIFKEFADACLEVVDRPVEAS